MSDKHYFPETAANQLVPRALRTLVRANTHLALVDSERVVYHKHHRSSKVALISGGGSGHEPAWAGYVGHGFLDGVACGDIFASPSMKQVLTAIRSCPSTEGTILLITNYTGDKLHFGLAAERAKALGLCRNVVVLPATDDVSIPRSEIRVGRRGMPGHVITLKIIGAAAAANCSFDQCVKIGRAVNSSLVSIGSALDHCHVPGRKNHEHIGKDVCVIGAGIHNEPGVQKLSPFPSVEDIIKHCLDLLCDQSDKERAFVRFNKDDEVVLLINNYGGLSLLELGGLSDEVLIQLEKTWNIKPVRILCGSFETSLNGPGFSISLSNLSAAARDARLQTSDLLCYLDAYTSAPDWPNNYKPTVAQDKLDEPRVEVNTHDMTKTIVAEEDIRVDPRLLDSVIREGCLSAIAAEPRLTEWDMVMGDGDCGEAVKGVSEAITALLDKSKIAADGSVLKALFAIIDAVDDMGGTLGAIFGIFLSSLASELQASKNKDGLSPELYSTALVSAAENLKAYTTAREGDRTVMDVLLPFVQSFAQGRDFSAAVKVAEEKAEGSRDLKPKLGRATYVSEDQHQRLPDPGAFALYEMLRGMKAGMQKHSEA